MLLTIQYQHFSSKHLMCTFKYRYCAQIFYEYNNIPKSHVYNLDFIDTKEEECFLGPSRGEQLLATAYSLQATLSFNRGQHQQALHASRLAAQMSDGM